MTPAVCPVRSALPTRPHLLKNITGWRVTVLLHQTAPIWGSTAPFGLIDAVHAAGAVDDEVAQDDAESLRRRMTRILPPKGGLATFIFAASPKARNTSRRLANLRSDRRVVFFAMHLPPEDQAHLHVHVVALADAAVAAFHDYFGHGRIRPIHDVGGYLLYLAGLHTCKLNANGPLMPVGWGPDVPSAAGAAWSCLALSTRLSQLTDPQATLILAERLVRHQVTSAHCPRTTPTAPNGTRSVRFDLLDTVLRSEVEALRAVMARCSWRRHTASVLTPLGASDLWRHLLALRNAAAPAHERN